jgi:hypothetical protein
MSLETVVNNYEWGWNLTRAWLLNFITFSKQDIFGNFHLSYDYGPRRDMEAERLFHKYSKMLEKGDKVQYCRGAIALIKEWDTLKQIPEQLEVFEEYENEMGENNY